MRQRLTADRQKSGVSTRRSRIFGTVLIADAQFNSVLSGADSERHESRGAPTWRGSGTPPVEAPIPGQLDSHPSDDMPLVVELRPLARPCAGAGQVVPHTARRAQRALAVLRYVPVVS